MSDGDHVKSTTPFVEADIRRIWKAMSAALLRELEDK
jgi:hypothetical protein